MFRGKTTTQWFCYMFQPEAANTHEAVCTCKPLGVLKVFVWVGISLLMTMGVSQLT